MRFIYIVYLNNMPVFTQIYLFDTMQIVGETGYIYPDPQIRHTRLVICECFKTILLNDKFDKYPNYIEKHKHIWQDDCSFTNFTYMTSFGKVRLIEEQWVLS